MDTAVSLVSSFQRMILKKRMKLVFKKETPPLAKTAFFSGAQLFELFLKLTVSNNSHGALSQLSISSPEEKAGEKFLFFRISSSTRPRNSSSSRDMWGAVLR